MNPKITRRQMLLMAAASSVTNLFPTLSFAGNDKYWLFVGAYTNSLGENVPTDFGIRHENIKSYGISSMLFNAKTGVLSNPKLAALVQSPVNLTIHPNKRFLFAGQGQGVHYKGFSTVAAFEIQIDGTLKYLNSVHCAGIGPSVGVVDDTGNYLLIPNWSSSSTVSIPIDQEGYLGAVSSLIGRDIADADGLGPIGGPNTPRSGPPGVHATPEMVAQGHTKPHGVVLSKNQNFAIVPQINANGCQVLRFDHQTGALQEHDFVSAPPHDGPRHAMFHPSYRWLYTSGEEGSTISSWSWDELSGTLKHLQSLSSLPINFNGRPNYPADVRVHPSGKFVYVTNRSTGTIAGFSVDSQTGVMQPIGQFEIGSESSWGLVFDPSGRWAIVSALVADSIRIYEVQSNGSLEFTGREENVVLPSCVRLV